MCRSWQINLLLAAVLAIGAQFERNQLLAEERVSFELEIQPILTANGCNAGACHGKQRGQNGFQLSLLGFDPEFDFAAVTKEGRGRRVFPAAPAHSLLLQKTIGQLPHGGGVLFKTDGEDYQTLLRWIAQGLPRKIENEPSLDRITVEPQQLLMKPLEEQQLRVTAYYSDGTSADVTRRTSFQSNETAIASVSDTGAIKAGKIQGETAVMCRYMSEITVSNMAIPLLGEVPKSTYTELPRINVIDELVWKKLEALRITPSAPVDDSKYLRRVYIDIIGRTPTAEEARSFLENKSDNRRAELVDELLNHPGYADHWANKWADLLRPNPYRVGIKATMNYDNWIRDQFRENRPYDAWVRDLLTASGSTWENGATTLFRDRRSPDEVTTLVSQLFLGIRLECAKCHHHPFEKWGQDDFYSFAAYFAQVGRKGPGISSPISGGEEMIFTSKKGSVSHPLTGEVMTAKPLFGEAKPIAEFNDPREAIAEWITSDENPFFAEVQVNRIWVDLMGRGIVVPVDDLRSTNPATNQPLLTALADHLRTHKYNLKEVIRLITSSHVYTLGSLPSDRNVADTRNFSRNYRQRLRAEVMQSSIDDITGVPTNYSAMAPTARANQIWTHRVDSLFLDTFGRPNENEDPPCERIEESTVTQALHLMNAPSIYKKVTSSSGTAAELAGSEMTADQVVEELYLSIYSRFPDIQEQQIGRLLFNQDKITRQQATEDLMWALLNTSEFILRD